MGFIGCLILVLKFTLLGYFSQRFGAEMHQGPRLLPPEPEE